jgi:predicted ATPase/DNA-binding SARP family transcriptional activator
MAELQLFFLGPGRVVQAQRGEVQFRGRLLLALLAYLAVESGQAHSRESLLGLLWPEMTEADARNNLRVTWSRLRKTLETASDVPFLIGTRFHLQFNPESSYWLDVAEFESLLAATAHHPHAERRTCPDCCRKLAQAAELYQGDFLAGFYLDGCPAFEEWQYVQRERLHVRMLEVLAELAHFYEHSQQPQTAEGYARRQLELDPLRENAHRQLMRVLYQQGQRPAALAQYEVCRRVLAEELGIEPDVETVRLYQQLKSGPPPASPASASPAQLAPITHNLPESTTPFIGREEELAQIGQRLRDGSYRLLSLVGPGGIGKTRLAIESARQNLHLFPDGAYFVPLASVHAPEQVPVAIATVLGLTFGQADRSPQQQLLAALRPKKMLLVLDNLEHLLAGDEAGSTLARLLLDLLRQTPAIVLLVTSREQLDLQAEDLYRLRGLPVPGPGELAAASRFAAVRLFCDRVYRLQKTFKLTDENLPHVVRICRLVEGMPLGLELAATWSRDLDFAELAAALDSNLGVLATTLRDVAPQHRSLYAAFDHSWQLLTPQQQDVLRQLAVFRGGFSSAAASQVAGATPLMLTRLRYKSLIRGAGRGRYDMHNLLWRFALEKLGEEPALEQGARRRHRDYFLTFVSERASALVGEAPQAALAEIRQDLDNVRQAWQWSVDNGHFAALDEGGRLAGLARFYLSSGLSAEGERVFERALHGLEASEADDPTLTQLRQQLLAELAEMLIQQSKLRGAIVRAEAVVRLASSRQDAAGQARGHQLLGSAYARNGEPAAARRHLETGLSLARQAGQMALEGEILRHLGNVVIDLGNRAQGESYLEQALHVHRTSGNRTQEQAVLLYLGVTHLERHEYVVGRTYLQDALRLVQATGDRALEARIENGLGFVLAALGQYEAALGHHQRSRQISQQIGDPLQESHALHNLCTVNRKLGRLETAEACGREALRLGLEHHLPDPQAYAWLHLGYVLLDMEQWPAAADAFARSRSGWISLGQTSLVMEATAGQAEAALRQGDLDEALAKVEMVLPSIAENSLDGTDEPFQIYLTCYRVLQAHDDARAPALLAEARRLLDARAALLPDEKTRQAFLSNIPVHRAITALFSTKFDEETTYSYN